MEEAAALRRFEELIRARCGIQMRAQEAALLRQTLRERALARRLAPPDDYLDFLTASTPAAWDEWKTLFRLLTNQESYFFRDAEQLGVIRGQILPRLLRRNAQSRTLRLWSAGCSTGEEVYSLAMMLEDVLPLREGWRVLLLGTDISETALERARRGVYGAWSFRALDASQRERFFTPRGKEWEVKPPLRQLVTFESGNLFDDPFPSSATELHDLDLIVCRNVFIYFGRAEVAHVLRKFSATLRPQGFLVAGHAELHGAPLGDLETISFPQSVVYQRRAALPASVPLDEKATQPPTTARFSLAAAPSVAPRPAIPTPRAAAVPPSPASAAAPSLSPAQTSGEALRDQAMVQIRAGRSDAALEGLNRILERAPHELAALCLAAQAQANRGYLDEAQALCRRALEVSSFAALPYQVLARIAGERGENETAKSLLKKVIYLDSSSVRAYLELAALYKLEGDAARAAQMTRAAQQILSELPDEALVPCHDYAVEARLTVGEVKRQLDMNG